MSKATILNTFDPKSISAARSMAHMAVQHLTALARANLEAQPDDSHSNLGWDASVGALVSHDITGVEIGLRIASLTLFIAKDGAVVAEHSLSGNSVSEATRWVDAEAEKLGLKPASPAKIPYDMPQDAAAITGYSTLGLEQELAALAAWFDVSANALEDVRMSMERYHPGPSAVRCWPHHFDIATYVALEEGDPETARGIGIGMAPGDGAYDEPYYYVNPWPHLSADSLGDAPSPGHWHTEGFVGLIATGTEITQAGDAPMVVASFLPDAVSTALKAQGLV